MRFRLLLILLVWMHLGDLVSAWLYDGGSWPAIGLMRNVRDLLVVVLASVCLLSVRIPSRLLVPILAYGGLAAVYLLWNRGGVTRGVLLGSFGTLIIPILFFLVGFYCVRQRWQLTRAIYLLLILGIASTGFGAWEQQHTEFWVDTLDFPGYMLNVKGLLIGANPDTGLPWNFYANTELDRRAAGLLASPLAQGLFLAVVALAGVACLERRARWLGMASCLVMFIGIWMSGTRAGMLAASLALVGYMATSSTLFRGRKTRLLMTICASGIIVLASYSIVQFSLQLTDGSTVGHWMALQKNLREVSRVVLLGAGLGQQGAIAAQQGATSIGGGEGAIFSIAFQLGLPAALLFLTFYGNLARALWRGYREHRDPASLAMFWLTLGIAPTLMTSEHMLAVSGTGAFWLLCGATLRSLPQTPHSAVGIRYE